MAGLTIISGCSGAGKSTLLHRLAASGHDVVAEPGRRVVRQERETQERALPWLDMTAFLRRTLALAVADLRSAAGRPGRTFFDRGLIDAAVALEHETGAPCPELREAWRYDRTVFLAPPWPDIYATDADRRHDFESAVAEYDRLADAFPRLGFTVILLPRASVEDRARFVQDRLAA